MAPASDCRRCGNGPPRWPVRSRPDRRTAAGLSRPYSPRDPGPAGRRSRAGPGRALTAYRATQLGPAAGAAGDGLARLTSREADVLRLVARGANNVEIAGELGISEVTVKTHIGHLFTKLGVRDRAAAIVWAFDH